MLHLYSQFEYLKHEDNPKFLESAQKVAKGILSMIDEDTYETTHLLNYPDLSVKRSLELFITMAKQRLLY